MAQPISTSAASLSAPEREVIACFVGLVQALGLPKSVGEIYGLLYVSPEPLSMEDIIQRLHISLGSASQGLKQLRSFNAVRTTYIPGQRRDYYAPETELRQLLANILREQMLPRLESGRQRLDQVEALMADQPDNTHLRQRIDKLQRWHARADKLLPLLGRAL